MTPGNKQFQEEHMPLKTVTMHHPEVERPADVPESAVHIHRRSGWVTEAELAAPATARKAPAAKTTKKKEGK